MLTSQAGFDVLNALTLLDNNMFLSEQKVSSPIPCLFSATEGKHKLIPAVWRG